MKTSFDFKVADEQKNDNGYRYSIEGLDVSAFSQNPVGLLNHNYDNVIGSWSNLNKTANKELYATFNVDEDDEDAVKIAKKIDKGLITGCSTGTIVDEINGKPIDDYNPMDDDNEDIVITKSRLKEISITPMPANTNSRKLYIQNSDGLKEITFNNKLELCNALGKSIKTQLKNMEETLKIEEIVEQPVIATDALNTSEVINIEEVALATDALEFNTLKNKYDESLTLIDSLTHQLTDFQIKFSNLEKEIKNKEIDTFLKESVRMGYIQNSQIEDFKGLMETNLENTKKIILKMPRMNPVKISIENLEIADEKFKLDICRLD